MKKDKNHKFAIKAMKKSEIIESKHVDHIENEKKILEVISHPFIVRLSALISRWSTTGSTRTKGSFTLLRSY